MNIARKSIRLTFLLGLALILPGHVSLSGAQGVPNNLPRTAMSGQTLMTFCASKHDVDAGFCSGYIAAVAEAMLVQPAYAQRACDHATVKPQQLVDTVKIEVDADPSLTRLPAGVMVAQVMAMSYPCYNDYAPAAGDGVTSGVAGYQVEPLPAPSVSSGAVSSFGLRP